MKKANRISAIESPFEYLLGRALSYVSFRPRSEKEIVTYCEKKCVLVGIDDGIIPHVCLRLKELGLFDDRKFSRWFCESRFRGKPVGRSRVRIELFRFGVPKSVADEALREAEMADSVGEQERVRKAAEKKLRSLVGLPTLKQKARLYSFLTARGFDGATIRRVVDGVVHEEVQ